MNNLYANWIAPANITALTTTREGGHSLPPHFSNNLAFHVNDDPQQVDKNRANLKHFLKLPSEPVWLEQTHSNRCIIPENDEIRVADAAVTRCKQTVLAIMTADCLPIVLCNPQGNEIAAIHAGWRGLAQGVVESTLAQMKSSSQTLIAWIGPAICRSCFEVGSDVKDQFYDAYAYTEAAFVRHNDRWLADLAKIAEMILKTHGVSAVYQSQACTFENKKHYYSYRREAQTGRMATLIWFNDQQDKL